MDESSLTDVENDKSKIALTDILKICMLARFK